MHLLHRFLLFSLMQLNVAAFYVDRISNIVNTRINLVTVHNNRKQTRSQCLFTSNQERRDKYCECLFSLRKLCEDVTQLSSSSSSTSKTIFVGGKGGVGKTTVSSALAVSLASTFGNDKVLIVSTDPAHSLGDALDVDLRSSRGKPVQMTDPLTGGRLYACELDASSALDEFRQNIQEFDINRLSEAFGVSADLLSNLGLQELSNVLNNPPPGLDELVALSEVLDRKDKENFDITIVDTAPTGHTLRLLALPQFLDGLLGKLIKLRMKLSGIVSTLQALLGNDQADQRAKAIDNAVSRLENFRIKMSKLRTALQDSDQTRFIVVTVPTKLGVAESKRLISDLWSQQVAVTDIVVNQCVDLDNDNQSETEEVGKALQQYFERRKSGQNRWILNLQEAADKVSSTTEYMNNGDNVGSIAITKVPFFDVELVGIPALGYVGSQIYLNNPRFNHLFEARSLAPQNGPKVVICGGKGGVGKTTTSASLAVTLAAAGHKVALISTDPAHSLGDAVDMNLSGGSLIECPLIGVPNNIGEGSLSVLEIDPSKSLSQFKVAVDQLVGVRKGDGENSSGLADTLRDLQEVFDTLPAGTDEVVALAKIVKLVKEGNYDCIILDTAPTGHTLRMLSTPSFLVDLIDRLLSISEKINSNAAVKLFLAASGKSEDISSAVETARSTLLSFQFQMYDLEDMFSNAKQTEFLIVTIPTELAVRESVRLLNDLTFEAPDMPIKVRNIIVNQVLGDDTNDARNFVSHLRTSQKASINELKQAVIQLIPSRQQPAITTVPYLDTEPRGVFGLKVLSEELLREQVESSFEMRATT